MTVREWHSKFAAAGQINFFRSRMNFPLVSQFKWHDICKQGAWKSILVYFLYKCSGSTASWLFIHSPKKDLFEFCRWKWKRKLESEMVIYDPTKRSQNAQIVMNCGIQIKNQNSGLVFKSRSLWNWRERWVAGVFFQLDLSSRNLKIPNGI